MKSAELEPQHILAGAFCWRASSAGGLQSSVGNPLAEPPLAIGPLSLEPRPLLAGKELGDHFRRLIVDTATIGATGFHQKRRVGNYGPGLCVDRQAHDNDLFHRCRHRAPVKLSSCGRRSEEHTSEL